jgi:hypothetical protein
MLMLVRPSNLCGTPQPIASLSELKNVRTSCSHAGLPDNKPSQAGQIFANLGSVFLSVAFDLHHHPGILALAGTQAMTALPTKWK